MEAVDESNSPGGCEFPGEVIRANSCVFTGTIWYGGFAKIGSVFPRLRASIWKSCCQKTRETVARA